MMISFFRLCALFFAVNVVFAKTLNKDLPEITSFFGEWKIVSYEEKWPSNAAMTKENIKVQIGQRMQLSKKEFTTDKNLLWLKGVSCKVPKYTKVLPEFLYGSSSQALLPDDHPQKKTGEILFFDVDCNARGIMGFEVTKNNQLMVFYDGYFFFFEKVK